MIDIFCLEIVIYLSYAFFYLPENWLLFFVFYLVIVHKLFFLHSESRKNGMINNDLAVCGFGEQKIVRPNKK